MEFVIEGMGEGDYLVLCTKAHIKKSLLAKSLDYLKLFEVVRVGEVL